VYCPEPIGQEIKGSVKCSTIGEAEMVDQRLHKKAHKLEICPACGGMMPLGRDRYTCEKCGHFEQAIELHDIVERDEPAKFCDCAYCKEKA
jgi:ribosomal protein S27AE